MALRPLAPVLAFQAALDLAVVSPINLTALQPAPAVSRGTENISTPVIEPRSRHFHIVDGKCVPDFCQKNCEHAHPSCSQEQTQEDQAPVPAPAPAPTSLPPEKPTPVSSKEPVAPPPQIPEHHPSSGHHDEDQVPEQSPPVVIKPVPESPHHGGEENSSLAPSEGGGSWQGVKGGSEPNDLSLAPPGDGGSSQDVKGKPSDPNKPINQPEAGKSNSDQGTKLDNKPQGPSPEPLNLAPSNGAYGESIGISQSPTSDQQPQKPTPTDHLPNGESVIKVLDSLKSGKELTQEIAEEFIHSPGTHVKSEPLAHTIRAAGGVVNSVSLTKGLIAGLIASPYMVTGGESLSPEILDMATNAGSPDILKALGIKMTPTQLAQAGKAAVTSIYGNNAF